MTAWMLVLPIVLPLVTALVTAMLRHRLPYARVMAVAGTGMLLAAGIGLVVRVWHAGPIAIQVGSWEAPFGITLVADLLAAVMVLVTAVTGLAVSVYALGSIDAARERFGYHPLFHVLLMGVCGAFLAGDLFNLYVWFEVMLIASFALLVLGNDREQVRGAVPYVVMSIVSSASFLAGIGLLYGLTGTLNLADLAIKLPTVSAGLVTAVAMLFLVAFGIKAAAFPLFFWLPASYHTPPVAVAAVFAGLLTKVGVYALLRTFSLLFVQDVPFTHGLLLVMAALTMLSGVLGAAAQQDIRRILSFHIVSQIGYMLMGLALFTPLALMGAVFYVVHHIIVKANLFLIGGVVARLGGSFDLDDLGGLYRRYPWLAVLFLVPALSLAGLPPLSGFWAKLILIRAGLDAQAYVIVGVALVVGLLTLYSMTKIWVGAFWKAQPAVPADVTASRPAAVTLLLPIAMLAALTVAIGLYAEPLVLVATRAADGLLEPAAYLDAVRGGAP
jgi:multicomponent Na+:H+ antiporter subunit D